MTGGVKMQFAANTINEAVMAATERWRVLAEDPSATLPWSTHYDFYEDYEPRMEDGRLVDGTPRTMCLVSIEFDRKVIDELTGAVEPDPSAKTV